MEDLHVEILVHIVAPSHAADDVRFRSLASAYVDFEPARRVDVQVPGVEAIEQPHASSPKRPKHVLPSDPSPSQEPILQTLPPGTFPSFQASFDSVIDNAGSPRIAQPHDEIPYSRPTTSSSIATSWHSPGSLVGDSQPEISSVVADLTTPTRLLEHYLQGFDSFCSSPWTPSQRTSNAASESVPQSNASLSNARQSSSRAPAAKPPQKQVLASFPTEEDSHDSSLSFSELKPVAEVQTRRQDTDRTALSARQPGISTTAALLPGPEAGPTPAVRPIPLSRSDSEPFATPQHPIDTTRVLHQALTRATSDLGPRLPSIATVPLPQVVFSSAHSFTLDSLELQAPEPTVASDTIRPCDLVTPQLRELLADAQPRRKAQTREQRRDLRPTERGYWHVDCSSWAPELQRATWAHLANWVGMGFAGWGTRCTRDAGFRAMRVYCWGEAAPYLYCLLWLTSYRRILSTDCVWIDADGETVVIMGTR
ncbi:hypothetical protein MN608_04963 [Microdochium nivale]|nr:hypothetical protein MN608_04963 [Microdochium nivale]